MDVLYKKVIVDDKSTLEIGRKYVDITVSGQCQLGDCKLHPDSCIIKQFINKYCSEISHTHLKTNSHDYFTEFIIHSKNPMQSAVLFYKDFTELFNGLKKDTCPKCDFTNELLKHKSKIIRHIIDNSKPDQKHS
jgi:hypothetical protein